MAEWRQRGYVPDSDDEDDEGDGLGRSLAQSQVADAGKPCVAQSKEELSSNAYAENPKANATTWQTPLSPLHPTIRFEAPEHSQLTLSKDEATENPLLDTAEQERTGLASHEDGTAVLLSDRAPKVKIHALEEEEPESPVANQLHQELRFGLEAVKQILDSHSTISEGHVGSGSGSSSPLSSVLSFATRCQSEISASNATVDAPQPSKPWSNSRKLEFSIEQARTRSLRQRNAIQVHPYALEGARYQRELLARGVKPLSLAHQKCQSSPAACNSQHSDSESDEDKNEEKAPSSQPNSPPRLQDISTNAVRRRPKPKASHVIPSDEELPDLEAILEKRHWNSGVTQKSSRGRKSNLGHNEEQEKENTFRFHELPPGVAGFTAEDQFQDDIFQVPLSPPNSRDIHSSQSHESFAKRSPRRSFAKRTTPQALPTPNISSAPPQERQPPSETGDDSDSLEPSRRPSSSASYPSDPERGSGNFSRLQRKIKGVLPASFVRLQGQRDGWQRNTPGSLPLPPDRERNALGVAHRLSQPSRLQNPVPQMTHPILISDESCSEEETSTTNFDHLLSSDISIRHNDALGLVYGETEEDNNIDRMIQPQFRNRNYQYSEQKRQRRVNEFFLDSDDQSRPEELGRPSRKKRRLPASHESGPRKRNRRTTRKVPALGPLDAPSYTNLSRRERPPFLRVAARRAKSLKGGGRQNPNRKFFKLATSLDTEDINTELRKWSNGLIEQNNAGFHSLLHREHDQETSTVDDVSSVRRPQRNMVHFDVLPRHSMPFGSGSSSTFRRTSPPSDQERAPVPQKAHRQKIRSSPSSRPSLFNGRFANLDTLFNPRLSADVQKRLQYSANKGLLLSAFKNVERGRDAQYEDSQLPTHGKRTRDTFQDPARRRRLDKVPKTALKVQTHHPLSSLQTSEPRASLDIPRQKASSRKSRKRPAFQFNPARMESSWACASEQVTSPSSQGIDPASGVVLAGLGAPEFPASHNFSMSPFPEGTRLHQSTFIGQGHLSMLISRLVHRPRNFLVRVDEPSVVTQPSGDGADYRWDLWSDHVGQQLDTWFKELRDCLSLENLRDERRSSSQSPSFVTALTSFTIYLGSHITFPDRQALDRFAEYVHPTLQRLVLQLNGLVEKHLTVSSWDIMRALCLSMVVVFEVACITLSASDGMRHRADLREAYKQLGLGFIRTAFRDRRLDKALKMSMASGGAPDLRLDDPVLETLVVLHHLGKEQALDVDIWELISEASAPSVSAGPENLTRFEEYERWWQSIFCSLPLLEFDATGLLKRRSSPPCWNLVQRLLGRFLSLYLPRRHNTGWSTKSFGRVVLQRCLDLIQLWGWQGGHSVIGAVFDAYSSNDMNEIFGEAPDHSFSIPLDLTTSSSIHVSRAASGFHTFLGFATQTILDSRKPDADPRLSKRVLRSLCARLVPTKGQELLKDQYPQRQSVIALRNRFDLISIMYCAMPVEMKPSLRVFQSFVNFRSAHWEACKVALEHWSQMVRHVVNTENLKNMGAQHSSADYAVDTLLRLSEWYEAIVADVLADLDSNRQDSALLSDQRLHETEPRHALTKTQNSIIELLKETLRASEHNLAFCGSEIQMRTILSRNSLGQVLKLFDAKEPVINMIVSAALQVVSAYAQKCTSMWTREAMDEDSQEYGSWDDFEGMEINEENPSRTDQQDFAYLLHEVQPLLFRFVSDVFGSDILPDHAILKNTTDCWFVLAYTIVHVKARSWDDFLGPYSSTSWQSLRHTQQTMQYSILFLSKVLDDNYNFYSSNRLSILGSWISALCRPNHLLCWEHLLTSAILFHGSDDDLLFNPPFVVRSDAGYKMDISMAELRKDRTAMIYIVLRNMHRLLGVGHVPVEPSQPYTKSDFSTILNNMEKTMKGAFQELEIDSNAQSDYRGFIHSVIQQMQVYVADFHKIDPFFSDPSIFSIEEHSVTAALKRYSLTIEATGVTKAMVLFLYNVSERAAISGDQESLVLQFQNAFLDLSQDAVQRIENHGADAILLASFLQHVLPVYVGHALSMPGHIVAQPMLRVLKYVYQNLRCRADLWNATALQRIVIATEVLLHAAVFALKKVEREEVVGSPQFLKNFNHLVEFIHAAMLRTYEANQDFPDDLTDLPNLENLVTALLVLKDQILTIQPTPEVVADLEDLDLLSPDPDTNPGTESGSDPHSITIDNLIVDPSSSSSSSSPSLICIYAEKELQTALDRSWRPTSSHHPSVPSVWEIASVRGAPKLVKASLRPPTPAPAPAPAYTTATTGSGDGTGNGSGNGDGMASGAETGVGEVDARWPILNPMAADTATRFVVREFAEALVSLVDWWG